jgi:hypothetical protein
MAGHRAAGRALLALAGAATLCLGSGQVRAEDPPAPFVVEASPGAVCESGETFATQLLRRTSRIRTATPGEEAVVFRVEVVGGVERPFGRLSVRELDGTRTERELRGATCQEVIAALALIAAILVDPNASLAPLPPPPARDPPKAPEPADAEPDENLEPPRPPRLKPITPAGARPPLGAVVRRRARAVPGEAGTDERPNAAFPELAAGEPDERASPSRSRSLGLGRLSVGLGISFALEGAPLTKPAAGAALQATLALERESWLSPLIGLSAVRTETVRVSTPSGVGEFRFTAFRLLTCPLRFPDRGAVDARPCALAETGTLEAMGKVTSRPATVSARWLALGAMARVAVRPWGPIALVLEPALVVPLIRHEFYFDPQGPETTALRMAPYGLSSRVGVATVLE